MIHPNRFAPTPCCKSCLGVELKYSGDYAAPGYGQKWVCPRCNKSWTRLAGRLVDFVPGIELEYEYAAECPCDFGMGCRNVCELDLS